MGQCTAISKQSKEQCKNWAIRGKPKCKFHGGKSTGPKTKSGKEIVRLAHLKGGRYTKERKKEHREVMSLIHQSKNLIRTVL